MNPNPYDDEPFFARYSQMNRSVKGLEGAGEWATLKSLLPDFGGKRVLDLGCGFGWHCQYALAYGASAVVGVDSSERMLAVAKAKSAGEIQYLHAPIEAVAFPEASFEVVISSLALHYIDSFEEIAAKVAIWLTPGGDFVFSVEHPIFTAHGAQDWVYDEQDNPLHFPVDHYFYEGQRETRFLGERVLKYHRTLTTYLNPLIQRGFELTAVVEPQPPAEMLQTIEGMQNELRRPMMLIVAARKR